jgi:hypothetical protein
MIGWTAPAFALALVCIVVLATRGVPLPFWADAARTAVLVRLSIVTAFLIALGGATVLAGQLVPDSTSQRCADF